MDSTNLIIDLLEKCQADENTRDLTIVIRQVAEQLRYYKERDLFSESAGKAKWIMRQIEVNESLISSFLSMLQYVTALKAESQKNHRCISELYQENQDLRVGNHLLCQSLMQTIDGYLWLADLITKTQQPGII